MSRGNMFRPLVKAAKSVTFDLLLSNFQEYSNIA